MSLGIPQKPFTAMLASGCILLAASVSAQTPTPVPTKAASNPAAHGLPTPSSRPKAKKNEDEPSIFKKPAAPKGPRLEPLGLSYDPELSGSLLDYDKLNADLYPILSDRPHTPTADEKFWGTVVGVANYSMAGVAAAQAVGILPG